VGAIRVDTDRLREYAKQVDDAAQAVQELHDAVNAHPLPVEAFGELGRAVRVADAYGRAATLLHDQLTRAQEVLAGVAVELNKVSDHYEGQEGDNARAITRSDRN